MACVNCYYYDSSYKGGYCDKDGETHSPYDSCSDFWDDEKKSSKSGSCRNCYYFDSSYHGGYCNLSGMEVHSGSSCSSFTE